MGKQIRAKEVLGPLSQRQEAFCRLYVLYRNGEKAKVEAGYSKKTRIDYIMGGEGVAERIQQLAAEKWRQLEMQDEEIKARLSTIGRVDVRQLFDENGKPRMPHELPDEIAMAVRGIETQLEFPTDGAPPCEIRKYKLSDPVPALRTLAQIRGLMGAEVNVNIYHDLADRMEAARARRREADKIVSEQ